MAQAKAKAMAALGLSTWRVCVLFPYATIITTNSEIIPMALVFVWDGTSRTHAKRFWHPRIIYSRHGSRCTNETATLMMLSVPHVLPLYHHSVVDESCSQFSCFYTVQIHKKYEYESDEASSISPEYSIIYLSFYCAYAIRYRKYINSKKSLQWTANPRNQANRYRLLLLSGLWGSITCQIKRKVCH